MSLKLFSQGFSICKGLEYSLKSQKSLWSIQ